MISHDSDYSKMGNIFSKKKNEIFMIKNITGPDQGSIFINLKISDLNNKICIFPGLSDPDIGMRIILILHRLIKNHI